MKSTEKLVQLLSTLQSDEKSHLVKQLNRGSENNHLNTLYRLISKQIKQDELGRALLNVSEEKLIILAQREGIAKNQFHVVRNHLQNAIFKVLRQLEEENTRADEIRRLQKDAQILVNRGLFSWAEEQLINALKIANDYHHTGLALQTLQQLAELQHQMDIPDYVQKLDKAAENISTTLESLQTEMDLYAQLLQTYTLHHTYKSLSTNLQNERWEALMAHPGFADPENVQSLPGRIFAFQARGLLEGLRGGTSAIQAWYKALYHQLQSADYKYIMEDKPAVFIRQLANYITLSMGIHDYSVYLKHIGTLENFKVKNPNDRAELFHHLYYLKQLYFLNNGKFEEGKQLTPTVYKGLEKFKFKITKSRLISMVYHNLVFDFRLEHYTTVVENHDAFFHLWRTSELRRDTQTAIRFLIHICHFELGNFEEMERFIRRIKPTLDTEAPNPEFDRIALTYFLEMSELYVRPLGDPAKDRARMQAFFQRFYDRLTAYSDANKVHPVGLFETIVWLRKKLNISDE